MSTDTALITEIRAGDKEALRTLVEKYKKVAYRLALGLVGNRDDAHDISQEAFIRVYRSAATFDDSKPFLPWFYTIISNLCRTWLKRRTATENRFVDLGDISFLLVDSSNPESALIKEEMITRLRTAIQKLSFQDREILTLQHFRNLSYDEIAALLGIPRGTVMSRLYYARKKLAKLMRDSDE